MKQIYLATTNKGKLDTVKEAFGGLEIDLKHVDFEIPEPRSDDLREIAKSKVIYTFKQIKKPCIAIDSGFYIHALNGFPRAYVGFVLKTIGVEGILKLVDGLNRDCEFRDCLAYFDKSLDDPIFFESISKGMLLESPSRDEEIVLGEVAYNILT